MLLISGLVVRGKFFLSVHIGTDQGNLRFFHLNQPGRIPGCCRGIIGNGDEGTAHALGTRAGTDRQGGGGQTDLFKNGKTVGRP